MIPGAFAYHAPDGLDEAVSLLAEHGMDASVLAGGQSLIPMMRFRLAEPAVLVDLNRVDGLDGLREEDGTLRIGAMARHAAVEGSDLVRERYPLLADAAEVIADPLVRNRGTVGGSLAHADPAGDWGAVMLASGAELVARGPDGERVLPIDDFFVALFTTGLQADEVLTEIRIPGSGPGHGGAYEKLERKVGDFATVASGVRLELDDDGSCRSAGIGLTAVGGTNLRAPEAEGILEGGEVDGERIDAASAKAAEECEPTSDNRGSEAYKRDMVRVLTARALRRAAERARATR